MMRETTGLCRQLRVRNRKVRILLVNRRIMSIITRWWCPLKRPHNNNSSRIRKQRIWQAPHRIEKSNPSSTWSRARASSGISSSCTVAETRRSSTTKPPAKTRVIGWQKVWAARPQVQNARIFVNRTTRLSQSARKLTAALNLNLAAVDLTYHAKTRRCAATQAVH